MAVSVDNKLVTGASIKKLKEYVDAKLEQAAPLTASDLQNGNVDNIKSDTFYTTSINRADNNGEMLICGGTGYGNGGLIAVRGTNRQINGGTGLDAGTVYMEARNPDKSIANTAILDRNGYTISYGNFNGTATSALGVDLGWLVDKVYPVGSIYMSVAYVSPSSIFSNTVWQEIPANNSIWSTDAYHTGGVGGLYTDPSLPNITGADALAWSGRHWGIIANENAFALGAFSSGFWTPDSFGAYNAGWANANPFQGSGAGTVWLEGNDRNIKIGVGFDASKSNGIYGKAGNLVKPNALIVHMWKRIS